MNGYMVKLPKKFLIFELKMFIGLLILHIFSILFKNYELPFVNLMNSFFNFKSELSIPTLFSTINLFLTCCFSFLMSKFDHKFSQNWLVMSFTFLFLTIDESCMVHETFDAFLYRYFDYLNLKWWMFYVILTMIFLFYNFPLLNSLNSSQSKMIMSSGMIFVMGSVFFSFFKNNYGMNMLTTFSTMEESLEMLGIIFFNYSMLKLITKLLIKNNLTLSQVWSLSFSE